MLPFTDDSFPATQTQATRGITVKEEPSFFKDPLPDDLLPLSAPALQVKREAEDLHCTISAGDSQETKESERKKRRLERNRETAKNCRRRKKERKEAIENEIQSLRSANQQLRLQVEKMSERAKSEEGPNSHGAFLSRLREYVRMRDEERIHGEIAAYYKEWSEVGQQRKTAAHYHLEQLKMLLLPTQVGAWGRVERR